MQITLLLFSLIIFMVGIAFATLGGVYYTASEDIGDRELLELAADDITLTVACMALIGSIIGVAGSITERKFILITFSVSMICTHVTQQVQAVMAFIDVMHSEDYVRGTLTSRFGHYNKSKVISKEIDQLQTRWQCCGIKGPQEWKELPKSCCKDLPEDAKCPWQKAFTTSCARIARARLGENMRVIASLAVVSGALEIVTAAYAWYLGVTLAGLRALRAAQERNHNPRGGSMSVQPRNYQDQFKYSARRSIDESATQI